MKRLNSEITQETVYRETGMNMKNLGPNTTGYKFTFDAQGNVLLTKKAPLHGKVVAEESFQFEVKQGGVTTAPLERKNL